MRIIISWDAALGGVSQIIILAIISHLRIRFFLPPFDRALHFRLVKFNYALNSLLFDARRTKPLIFPN